MPIYWWPSAFLRVRGERLATDAEAETVARLRNLASHFDLYLVTPDPLTGPGQEDPAVQRLWPALARAGVRQAEAPCGPNPRPHAGFAVSGDPQELDTAARAGLQGILVGRDSPESRQLWAASGLPTLASLSDVAEWIRCEYEACRRMGNVASAVQRAAARLSEGGVVAFPTETVYGLGASALDSRAVAQIFEIKHRPRFDPLIVHVADAESTAPLVKTVPDTAARLMERFWPGPLTLVLPKHPCVPDIVTAGLPNVAVRAPRHPIAQRLLRTVRTPIAAPSANRFGGLSPTTAEAVREQLGDAVEIILDAGPCPIGVESTILAFEGDTVVLLRAGGLPIEDIEAVVGPVRWAAPDAPDRPRAPGRLPRHYAPRARLRVWSGEPPAPNPRAAVLAFRAPPPGAFAAVEVLSSAGDLVEAAARFFEALRILDRSGAEVIWAERVPDQGLGRAMNERLRRAATPAQKE